MGVDGNSMNDTRKKGGLQTVLQQQQSKKLKPWILCSLKSTLKQVMFMMEIFSPKLS